MARRRRGEVLGYAYATQHRTRAAYRFAVDVSVYVAEHSRQRGVGRALYQRLFELLTAQGFCSAHAGIALPNESSVRLHESLGFQRVGTYPRVGYKLGRWIDTGWWQKRLDDPSPRGGPPTEPIPFGELPR